MICMSARTDSAIKDVTAENKLQSTMLKDADVRTTEIINPEIYVLILSDLASNLDECE